MHDAVKIFGMALKIAPLFLNRTTIAPLQPPQTTLTDKDLALIELKRKDGAVIVVLGTRDTGKTEMCYRIAEFIGKPTCAVSPEQKPHPKWIQRIRIEELDEVRPGSTILLDDLPAYMSNRDYNDALIKTLERIIPMVRHERKWHLIFSSQSSAQADKYILDCDAAFLKPLGLLMGAVERPNIARIYKTKVDPFFAGKNSDWIHKHAYMLTRSFSGIIEISMVE